MITLVIAVLATTVHFSTFELERNEVAVNIVNRNVVYNIPGIHTGFRPNIRIFKKVITIKISDIQFRLKTAELIQITEASFILELHDVNRLRYLDNELINEQIEYMIIRSIYNYGANNTEFESHELFKYIQDALKDDIFGYHLLGNNVTINRRWNNETN